MPREGLIKGVSPSHRFSEAFCGAGGISRAFFQAEDKEARTSEKRGREHHGCVELFMNVYLPHSVLLAHVCLGSACIGRGPPSKMHFQTRGRPESDQTVLRSASFPALGSDHRTASCKSKPTRFPQSLRPSQSCSPTPTHHFPTASPFFFCGFLSSTFAGSIISGHRATAVSTSEGIYYAAARG